MKVIRPIEPEVDTGYTPQVGSDGVMRCSCGRSLVKVDEDTYKCAFGFPRYRFSMGEITLDKFGNLLFAAKDHGADARAKQGAQ